MPPDSPPATPPRRPRIDPLLLPVLAAALGLWVSFLSYTHIRLEDALITYRYAENLALGKGFAFNPGERVLGTTSPLHTLLLAAFGKVLGVERIPSMSAGIMLAAAMVTLFFLYDYARRATGSRVVALVASAAWALIPDTLWTTAGGMETALVILLLVASASLAIRGRWIGAGIAAGLLPLARADGLVWAALLLAFGIARLRLRVLRPLVAGLLVMAPWIVFAWLYFGSPLPHSILAKREIFPSSVDIPYLRWLLNSTGLGVESRSGPVEMTVWLGAVLLGALTVIARPGCDRLVWLAVLFPPAFAAALALGKAPWFPWYMVPVSWCSVLVGVLGCREVLAMVRDRVRERAWSPVALPVLVAFWVVSLAPGTVRRDVDLFRYWRDYQENETSTRGRIGEWIAQNTPPDATVVMEAIGYQGALSRRRVVDLAGLISPEVVRIHRESHSSAQTFQRVLERFQPQVVVLRTWEFRRNEWRNGGHLFDDPGQREAFLASYEPALELIAPHPELWERDAGITVWRRKP